MSEHTAPAGQRSGILLTIPLDGGPVIQQDTVSCVHCQCVWVWQPGSGRKRGFCTRCNGFICGPQCAACVPFEQWLENVERGRPEGHRPIVVSINAAPPQG